MTIAAYVEIDAFACAWLRELIKGGHICDGEVFEQPLENLRPSDLARFDRVHLCAGIGIWDYALNEAGWGDQRVWTASFPCQPFSAAGKGLGFADERHIWPSGLWLVQQSGVDILLGEQVASKDGLAWFDTVSADLEAEGYTVGAVDLCAAGFGAPHIRQRNYWCGVDNAVLGRHRITEQTLRARRTSDQLSGIVSDVVDTSRQQERFPGRSREPGGSGDGTLAHTDGGNAGAEWQQRGGKHGQQSPDGGAGRGMADDDERLDGRGLSAGIAGCSLAADDSQLGHHQGLALGQVAAQQPGALRIEGARGFGASGLVRGRWAGADWIFCRDGKWRPVESGTFPLATGYPNHVGTLRSYGNALTAPVAQGFIEAVMDVLDDR